jgi:SpoVK/Ycf46/Vps4 family AAA+-type ATPase
MAFHLSTLLTVLVLGCSDEVESLTAARAGAMSGKDPSDGLRVSSCLLTSLEPSLALTVRLLSPLQVVNALLTQLDKLRKRTNCLVLATSNLTGAIDPAFMDRADLTLYIGQ